MTAVARMTGVRGDAVRELRREPRLSVRFPAQLLVYRHRYDIQVVDLSDNGAMVAMAGTDAPAKGDEVVLARDGFEVVATVAWAIAPHCGLAFHRAIDAARVARLLRDSTKLRVKH